jgi:hypothetical protein
MGILTTSASVKIRKMPSSMASATPRAEILPLNESGATTMRIDASMLSLFEGFCGVTTLCAAAVDQWVSSIKDFQNIGKLLRKFQHSFFDPLPFRCVLS